MYRRHGSKQDGRTDARTENAARVHRTKQGGGIQSRNGSIPFLVANVGRTTRTT